MQCGSLGWTQAKIRITKSPNLRIFMQIELDLSNILLDQFVVQLGECNVVGWDGRGQEVESPNVPPH